MTIVNIALVFLNICIFTLILWLRHLKKRNKIKRAEKRKQDLIKYQAKLDAKIHSYKRKG